MVHLLYCGFDTLLSEKGLHRNLYGVPPSDALPRPCFDPLTEPVSYRIPLAARSKHCTPPRQGVLCLPAGGLQPLSLLRVASPLPPPCFRPWRSKLKWHQNPQRELKEEKTDGGGGEEVGCKSLPKTQYNLHSETTTIISRFSGRVQVKLRRTSFAMGSRASKIGVASSD